MNKVYVISSDMRQRAFADELSARGIKCDCAEDFLGLDNHDVIMLPYVSFAGEFTNLPQREHFSELLPYLRRTMTVFAGMYPEQFKRECTARGVRLIDWFGDEELTVKNAYLTAEGALGLAVNHSPRAIKDSLVTVIGYGRVAKACAEVFSALGAHIKVMARSYPARIDAYTHGYKSYEIENDAPLADADVIINTVPTVLLTRSRLEKVGKNAIILELASKPYGIDIAAANELSIPLFIAPGLPAKTAPVTAGRLMADMAMRYLKEGGTCG